MWGMDGEVDLTTCDYIFTPRTAEDVRSPGAGAIGRCELHKVGALNGSWVLWKSSAHS